MTMKFCSKCNTPHSNAADLCDSCRKPKGAFAAALASSTVRRPEPPPPAPRSVQPFPSVAAPAQPVAAVPISTQIVTTPPPAPLPVSTAPVYVPPQSTYISPSRTAAPADVPSLVGCIVMDVIGMGSYIMPGFGEFFDVIWAPIAGVVFIIMFRQFGVKGILGGVGSFAEEAFPGLDIIPTFTIGHFLAKSSVDRGP